MKSYITKVKDPHIREYFTRLRIDMNLLNTSKSRGEQQSDICKLCNIESETVEHFLLKCHKYENIRNEMLNSICSVEPDFRTMNENEKMRYILDLNCPENNIGVCCNFVFKIYKQRELDHS